MTEGWTLSAEDIERLAGALIPAGRLLGTAAPEAVAGALGWGSVRYFGGDEVVADAGVPAGDSVVLRFVSPAGRRVFTEARVSLAEAPAAAGRAIVVDAFADAASALEATFGRVTTDRPGTRPTITWQLDRIKESRVPWRRRFATMTLELSPHGCGVDLAIRPEDEAARLVAAARAETARAETARAETARAETARAEAARAEAAVRSGGADAWADGDWDRFAAVLTAELADLEPDHVMILSDGVVGDSFVQFFQFGEQTAPYLGAETISDQFRDDDRPLTAEQRRQLAGLGWYEPPPDPGNEANWSYHLRWPARWSVYRRLADLAVATLRDVHGIPSPADLVLGGSGYDDAGPVPYPRLGLTTDR
jgi:hypothetical protein